MTGAMEERGMGSLRSSCGSDLFRQLELPVFGTESDQATPPSAAGISLPTEVAFGALAAPRGSAHNPSPTEAPMYGPLLSVGQVEVSLRQGEFQAHLFKSMSDGKYLIALSQGDITTEDPLLIRLHSECITSESLRGCDCDCVEQLDAALTLIAEEGRGILFYLLQEGRGAGYPSKAQDREMVAASENTIETFKAYNALGLRADLRTYEVVLEAAHLLGLPGDLVIMSNNPSKWNQLQDIGFQITGRREVSAAPNPFNSFYVATKAQSGHQINQPLVEDSPYPWSVERTRPAILEDADRFVRMAKYPLPLHPSEGEVILRPEHISSFHEMESGISEDTLVIFEALRSGSARLIFNPSRVAASPEFEKFIARHPHWFQAIPYHDHLTTSDFVALVYPPVSENITPVVRVHFEDIFHRLPLHEDERPRAYERSLAAIAEQGNGAVILYPKNCHGNEIFQAFRSRQGAPEPEADRRDYDAVALLIREHYGQGPIQLVYCSSEESVSPRLVEALSNLGIRAELLDLDNKRTD